MNKTVTATYMAEVANLGRQDGGLHFNISCIDIKKLEEFSVKDLMHIIRQNAPQLWEMLATVMSARSATMFGTGENNDTNDADMYWEVLDGGDIRRGQPTQRLDRQKAIAMIVSTSVDD